jgi:PAS domain S-box-containing protein
MRRVPGWATADGFLSMQSNTTRQFRSLGAPALVGTIATALVTLVCYWLQPGALPAAMLYVFVVVMVSLRGNLFASVWVSLLAVAALDYFFTSPPFHVFPVRQVRDVVALISFLSTAVVINRLIVRMRQSLREAELAHQQLRLVIDTVPTLLSSARPDGQVEFVNQGWRDFGGLSVEEVKGWKWVDALHPDDQDRFVADYRAALASGVPLESEARLRRADGEYRRVLLRAVPLRDQRGTIVQWYGAADDIEEWKRAEEKVRQGDHERRALTDTIPALLWTTLPDGSSDFNNQRWLEYTGLSAEQAAGWGYIDVIHPEDYERRTPKWSAAFAAGEPMEDEARLRRADGQYRWFLHRAVPLRDEGGKILKWVGTSTDIEDLKRAEGVLREQAGLLDLSHDSVFVRDMSDVITYWNRGAEALYGWSRDQAIGHTSHRLTQTIFPAPLEEINEELLRTGRWEGELVHTKRDGSPVVVASRWSLQRDELGQPAAILETNNDVTEHKRAEAELRGSEGRYRNIFQSAAVSIWEEDFSAVKIAIDELRAQGVTDFREYLASHPDFVREAVSMVRLIDVNETTLTLLRARSKDELLVSLDRIFLPETQAAFVEELIAIAEGRTRFEAETVLQTLEGERLSVLFTIAFPAESATLDTVLVTVMDITERKRLENELRRSQTYLVAGQELSHTGSMSRLVTGQAYWSEEMYRIYGLDPANPPPSSQQLLQIVHPDDRHVLVQAWETLNREARSIDLDFRIIRPDGALRYLHATSQPVLDRTGAVVEVIGAVMDVTDRKRAERALRRARERALESRFAAVLEERTRLARDIHDTLLQGFTGIALKLVAASSRVTQPPESIAALQDLIGLAQQTLIDARRAVWDLRSPALADGDFPAAVRNAVEDCVRGTKLELEYTVGGPPQRLDSDTEAVVIRVAQEAVTNVVKHAEARTVQVRLSFAARRVRLSVIDDGRGFAVESDFHAYGGHWGLLGMRERASQVRGKLSLQSTPGQGTELVLLVPYAPAHRPNAASVASSVED